MIALLVVGSAPCVHADLKAAQKLFPAAEVMTVNGACSIIEDAQHCLAGHTDKVNQFVAARAARFPSAAPVRWHANWAWHRQRRPEPPYDKYPVVTDWHGAWASSGATSAGKAALIGMHLGYDPIVLCGCPLDGRGYDPNEAVVTHDPSTQRVGNPKTQNASTIRRYRETMQKLARTTFKGRVFSMSGFTREVLGAPC